MLSIKMLSVNMLIANMLIVIMLSVVAPLASDKRSSLLCNRVYVEQPCNFGVLYSRVSFAMHFNDFLRDSQCFHLK